MLFVLAIVLLVLSATPTPKRRSWLRVAIRRGRP